MPTFRTEFPDFDPATLPAIPDGFTDISWHNEACPCFTSGYLNIWTDYADPAQREWEGTKRFSVVACDETGAGEDDFPILATDDWAEVVAFLQTQMTSALPPALHEPITDLASGRRWLDALSAAGLTFHLEDDPRSIVKFGTGGGERLFNEVDAFTLRKAVAALYAIPDWGAFECPIGYILHIERHPAEVALARLSEEYDAFLAGTCLPGGSADELVMFAGLQAHERLWLHDFIRRWEHAESREGEADFWEDVCSREANPYTAAAA